MLPIAYVSRMILQQGAWPNIWKFHWVHPLYKRKEKWNQLNYRGLHLTSQLSKVMERIFVRFFQPSLEASVAYGPRQFAYTTGRGYKDALAYNICSWLLAISLGQRIGLYCCDVSGAFDRVSTPHLMAALRRCSAIPRAMLSLLLSWFAPRSSTVVVDGVHSSMRSLANSVFQGTVLGPILWNRFFESSRFSINSQGFTESVFADDCNCFRAFDGREEDSTIITELGHCQAALHAWGRSMRVVFDSSKEGFYILSPRRPLGEHFRILGVCFDTKLTMDACCQEVAAHGHNQVTIVLRTRRFHCRHALIRLYKPYVLPYIESGVPAYYHAPSYFLSMIDRVQAGHCHAWSFASCCARACS